MCSWIPQNLIDLGAFAQVVQFFVILVALIFAKRQMTEAGRSRMLAATREVLNEIANDEVRSNRSWVLDSMPATNPNDLTPTDHAKARSVAVSLDRVGYMVRQHLIPDRALYEWQRDEIGQLWPKLKPLVLDIRSLRGRPSYCTQFEWLATDWLPRVTKRYGRR